MNEEKISRAVREITRSPEYLGLSGFLTFFDTGCRGRLIRFTARRYAKEIRILFSLLRKRVMEEMKSLASSREKLDFWHEIRRQIPAFPKFFQL